MRQFKFLSAVCCLVTALTVTSCLSDSDDNNNSTKLTSAEVEKCRAAVKGDYQGKIIYYSENSTSDDLTDTLDIAWRIPNDTILTISQFPSKVLATRVSYEPLKVALMEAPDQPLECYYGFFNADPIEFVINPMVLTYNLNYSGADHKVQVLFYYNTYDSFGRFDTTSRVMIMQIIEGGIYIDGQQSTYLIRDTPFLLVSQSKL